MNKLNSSFKLSALDYRIFLTLQQLEERHLYTNALGLYEIFLGLDVVKEYDWLTTFKTLKNTNSKHISMRLIILKRRGYIKLIYNPKDEQMYYGLTSSGKISLSDYLKKSKKTFKKFIEKTKKNIVEIK